MVLVRQDGWLVLVGGAVSRSWLFGCRCLPSRAFPALVPHSALSVFGTLGMGGALFLVGAAGPGAGVVPSCFGASGLPHSLGIWADLAVSGAVG